MTASNLGVTTYLVPPITVVMAWVLLSEVPPPLAYAGGVLCLAGVALARRRPRSPKRDERPTEADAVPPGSAPTAEG
jgi:drug/metabolite transporter (DMT)-like permease